jgi:hypothetical protein
VPEEIEIDDLELETSLITFASEVLGHELYQWQADVLEPFDHASEEMIQVSLSTPNGSGKSSVVISSLVLGWLALYPKAKVVLTTADGRQIDSQVMPAIEAHRGKFPDWKFIYREVHTPTGGMFVAFTTDDAGRAEGWHKLDDFDGPLCIIVDEAKTVDEKIFSAFDRCTYNAILITSSPGKMSGTFYESQHNPDLGYIKCAVGLKDCPHITQDKIDRIIAKWGPNHPFTRSSLHGEFIEIFEGKPVHYAYSMEHHEAPELPWPKGAYLIRGWDFGTSNAIVWSAYWEAKGIEYWWDLCEQYYEGSDTDRQVRNAIIRTDNEFPFHDDREQCAGVLDYIDPAGANSSYTRQIKVTMNGRDTTVAESSANILRTHGIYPGMRTVARGLQETLAVVNRLMEKRDPQGRWCYRIDVTSCPRLARAYRGGYRYPAVGESGYGNDAPMKGAACDNLDHLADAARYGKINCLRLLQDEMAGAKPPLFAAKKKSVNPVRKI